VRLCSVEALRRCCTAGQARLPACSCLASRASRRGCRYAMPTWKDEQDVRAGVKVGGEKLVVCATQDMGRLSLLALA
jgi:hypothetical protein